MIDPNEIREKIKADYIEEFRPIAEEMAKGGSGKDEIVRFFEQQVELKLRQFYKNKRGLESFSDIFKKSGLRKIQESADSKAERIFCEMLTDNGIEYKFQVQIGKYRVDYLINNYLILELDGPQHEWIPDLFRDYHFDSLGYRTIRIPIWILAVSPEAVIDEIKAVVNG